MITLILDIALLLYRSVVLWKLWQWFAYPLVDISIGWKVFVALMLFRRVLLENWVSLTDVKLMDDMGMSWTMAKGCEHAAGSFFVLSMQFLLAFIVSHWI